MSNKNTIVEFSCMYCNHTEINSKDIRNHLKNSHTTFNCKLCDKKLTIQQLKRHELNHYGEKKSNVKNIKCIFCGAYRDDDGFHYCKLHFVLNNYKRTSQTIMEKQKNKLLNKKFIKAINPFITQITEIKYSYYYENVIKTTEKYKNFTTNTKDYLKKSIEELKSIKRNIFNPNLVYESYSDSDSDNNSKRKRKLKRRSRSRSRSTPRSRSRSRSISLSRSLSKSRLRSRSRSSSRSLSRSRLRSRSRSPSKSRSPIRYFKSISNL